MNKIKMDVLEIGCGVQWIALAQDKDNWRARGNEVSASIKCWKLSSGCTAGGVLISAQLCSVV
jgi:hypothetical protein